MYKLVIQDDEGKTTVVPLIRDELTIGRKEGNTIRLTERNVSRRHARVLRSNGSISIEDLGSFNGIRVNGSRIEGTTELSESDRVQIGDYLIEVKAENAKAHSGAETEPVDRIDPLGHTPVPTIASQDKTIRTGVPAAVEMEMETALTVPMPIKARTPPVEAAPAPQTPPRLVVLSTNYAGREYELDKPAMVIGRTDENDIWINHRSISRHHAKLVLENGRYSVVDLQSSNGVRVNGEEYGKVELRRADVVDLGHVRMRFVEAGEDFVFGRDAQAVDIAAPAQGRGGLWAILALMIVGGGVALLMMNRGGAASSAADKPIDASVPIAKALFDAAPAVVPPPPPPPEADPFTVAMQAAETAIQAEQWAEAHTAAQTALKADPTSTKAKALSEQAKAELKASTTYIDFERCKYDDYSCIVAEFSKLDSASLYRDKAQAKHDGAKKQYLAEVDARGRSLASASRCSDLKQLAADGAKLWPEARAVVLRHRCREAAPPPPPPPPPPDNKISDEELKQRAESLLAEAKRAQLASQYGRALGLCEQSLKLRRTDEAARRCAIAACYKGSADKARRYINLATPSDRDNLRKLCQSRGITIP